MNETLIESYVLFSETVLFRSTFPFNFIILAIGSVFGIFHGSSWLIGVAFGLMGRVREFFLAALRTKEPLGLYGAVLSTAMAFLSLTSFVRDGNELELLLRCDRTDEFSILDRYLLISVRCAVKNGGNITATIDTIEPTFYYSERIDLARGREDRSYHSYRGDPNELVSKDFILPQTLQPGVTKVFDANVAIPIGWWEEAQTDRGLVMTTPDVEALLSDFVLCKETEPPEICFQWMTGKFLPNYLYETINYPAGAGGEQPINGVGISVSDFSYSSEVEVDLYSGAYPRLPNEGNELLSDEGQFNHLENIRRPWWTKLYTSWTIIDQNHKTGVSINFVDATLRYLIIALSIFGWILIAAYIWRRIPRQTGGNE